MHSKTDFDKPDFAFPVTVEKEATPFLNDSDAAVRFKALMEIVSAKSAISPDSLMQMPAFIASCAAKEMLPDYKGLMTLYEAAVLGDIYNQNRWSFDRIDAPLEPLPADVAAWSGEQFRAECSRLVDEAMTLLTAFDNRPLYEYSRVISIPQTARPFFPVLKDFVYRKAANICPERRDEFVDAMVRMCEPGTGRWAYWAVAGNMSDERLHDLYVLYPSGICGAYLLWNIVKNISIYSDGEEIATITDMLKKYLESEAPNELTQTLNDCLSALSVPRVEITGPDMAAPGEEIKVVCRHGFSSLVGVELYRRKNGNSSLEDAERVNIYTLSADKSIAAAVDSITFAVREPGYYFLVPYYKGAPDKTRRDRSSLLVTPWLPLLASQDNGDVVAVVDFSNGAPAQGVRVGLKEPYKKSVVVRQKGTTAKDGMLKFQTPDLNRWATCPLVLSDGKTPELQYEHVSVIGRRKHSNNIRSLVGSIFVSRPVYRQGDSVEWAVVAAIRSDKEVSLKNTERLLVSLYDTNYQLVDTASCATDEYGRAHGSFKLPEDGLTGRFTLKVTCPEDKSSGQISNSFMVSDFKMPVFEIENLEALSAGDSIEISGCARRYSGAPVPDAQVMLTINDTILASVTSADGTFRISVPTDMKENMLQTVTVDVTAVTGESVQSSLWVRFGKPYELTMPYSLEPMNIDNGVILPVKALDVMRREVELEVKWTLKGTRDYEGITRITPKGLDLSYADIISGIYTLAVENVDGEAFEPIKERQVVLYSVARNVVPSGAGIILPSSNVTVAAGSKVMLKVGNDSASHVYFFYQGRNGADGFERQLPAGFSDIEFENLSDTDCRIAIAKVVNGKVNTASAEVKRVETQSVVLEGISWRDNLIPGTPEQWTFRFSKDSVPQPGAMIATMYNRALDSFSQLTWPSNLSNILKKLTERPTLALSLTGCSYTFSRIFGTQRRQEYFSVDTPSFLYIPEQHILSRGVMMMKAMAVESSNSMAENASYIVEDEAEDGVSEAPLAGSASEPEEFKFRNPDVTQALWAPALTVDDDGITSIHFTMPDAVGAWAFHAVAWNSTCASLELMEIFRSSRPVMVSATVPRFLRRGDKATLSSTVINTLAEAVDAVVTMEIFDPSSGKVIATKKDTVAVAAESQCIVNCGVDAMADLSSVGFRVKASAASFTDGEQWEIPVLESVTTAIDSDLFYLSDENPSFESEIRSGAEVSLEYCQNPVWDAVKALPGMYNATPSTSTAAASSAYASFIARELFHRFPSISEALKVWEKENDGAALISNLEKNEELKLLTLANTPFVGAASANTEQMKRLALTFNTSTIDATVAGALKVLDKLQMADGGFAWGSWENKSSHFSTLHFLTLMGRLNSLGCSPRDKRLDEMIEKAFRYIDSTVEGKGTDYSYTLAYSLYPGRKPSTLAGSEMIGRVQQDIIRNWKKATVADKCVYAIILQGLGNTSVAREIMRSVSQFAVKKPGEGIEIPTVNYFHTYAQVFEAYGRVFPESPVVSGIRQWLVLNTRNVSGMGTWSPETLVAAILLTGETLTANTMTDISIGGKPFVPGEIESYTGAFTERLDSSPAARKVEINLPAGCTIAYGALVSVSDVPLDEVKPFSNKYVSVDKRFLVERDGKWTEADSFRKGEKVRVQMIVKTDRPMEYVTIVDNRAAAFEPLDQMPGRVWDGSVCAYRENRDDVTNLFISWLPRGVWHFAYDVTATYSGSFASGTANFQCQQAPEFTARSGAHTITVK